MPGLISPAPIQRRGQTFPESPLWTAAWGPIFRRSTTRRSPSNFRARCLVCPFPFRLCLGDRRGMRKLLCGVLLPSIHAGAVA